MDRGVRFPFGMDVRGGTVPFADFFLILGVIKYVFWCIPWSLKVSGMLDLRCDMLTVLFCKNLKSFKSHKAHRAALISVSLALSQTPVYTARPRIRGCIARCACLRPSFRWYSLHKGMARLSWPGWLVTYRDGLPAGRRSPIQVLTGPGVD